MSDCIIRPIEEMAAYETLWEHPKTSFKTLAEIFRRHPGSMPTDLIDKRRYNKYISRIISTMNKLRADLGCHPNLILNGSLNYPSRLRDAKEPVELLYYAGNLGLIYGRSVAIIGTRRPSDDGIRRTEKMAKLLVEAGFTIVSGLASGIDTAAHKTALINNGKTIAVIGTPLNSVYPKENAYLQNYIAKNQLLVSQVPFIKYENQDYRNNRLFFPERNKTMSAITEATIIIEADETSGTLIQARAALHQGRKLFILNSCFENDKITWPHYYEQKGAIRVKDFSDVLGNLNAGLSKTRSNPRQL